MAAIVSQYLVAIFGAEVLVLSVWGFFAPTRLMQLVKNVAARDYGLYVAVFARVVLGIVLLIAAPVSRFPLTLTVLGWFTLAAAAVFSIGGRNLMQRTIVWFDRLSATFIRLWVLLGVAFGGFLLYAVSAPV